MEKMNVPNVPTEEDEKRKPVLESKNIPNMDWDQIRETKIGERTVNTGKEFTDATGDGALAEQVENDEFKLAERREHIAEINEKAYEGPGMSPAEESRLKEMQATMAKNAEKQAAQAEEQSLPKKSLAGRIKGWFS